MFEKGNNMNPTGRTGACLKSTISIKEMIQGALDDLGGKQYLVDIAKSHPASFLTLVGKCMPAPQPEIHNNLHLQGQWSVEVVEPAQVVASEAVASGDGGGAIKDKADTPDNDRPMITDQGNDEDIPAGYSANTGLPAPVIPDLD